MRHYLDIENHMVTSDQDDWTEQPDFDTEHAEYMSELRREDDERLNDVLRDIASIRRVDMFADQCE